MNIVFRHKFTEKLTQLVSDFAANHRGDSLAEFRKSWTLFVKGNQILFDMEQRRLADQGVDDVLEKLYTSARYWHRKKQQVKEHGKPRTKHVASSKSFLEGVDLFIESCPTGTKPSIAFEQFCRDKTMVVKTEIDRLRSEQLDTNEIRVKIKKTFKNRYFVCHSAEQ